MPDLEAVSEPSDRREIFVSRIGGTPTQPAHATDAFLEAVFRFCARIASAGAGPTHAVLAFVQSERGIDVDPVYDQHSDAFAPCGRLDRDTGPVPDVGPIVFATRNLRTAYATGCDGTDVPCIVSRIKELGLGSRPTALYLWEQRMLVFHRHGVEGETSLKADTAALSSLDPSDLDRLLDYFHDNWTRYPTGFGACWDNAINRVVERNAERNIRNHLFIFLNMVVFRSKYVIREFDRPNGRIDIFIFGVAMGEEDRDRVIELKVLRSRSSGWTPEGGRKRTYSEKGNRRYVERGIRQARRYIDSTSAVEAFLLCYDARLEDVHIVLEPYADSLAVTYRRYFMESSAKEA
ncbi:hypothetical protein D8770_27150 [Methylobacterium sp. DB1607]|nr:hypothetical protein [Methylobacterium sp. DB1607]